MIEKIIRNSEFVKNLIEKFELYPYDKRLHLGIVERPHYGYCVYNAAILAKKLGYEKISILEIGVAGGNGLLNLEYHAEQVSRLLEIQIEVYGFDTGEGLPELIDYRDLPYFWKEAQFKMNVSALKAKLTKAELVLGNIKDTVKSFFKDYNPAPIAAIMFDLDFYSSTADAFKIFEEDEQFFLPRIYCYFDDLIGSELELYSDYTGVRLAINEFNQNQPTKKFGKAYHLIGQQIVKTWFHQIFIYHDFAHSKYDEFIGKHVRKGLDLR